MLKSFYYFLRLIVLQRHLILTMARREVATQYVGSVLGFLWTFIHPLVMILVFWVVFSLGFKVQPKEGVPFVVWFAAGLAAWNVFADMVNGSAGVVVGNAHLIKKTLFQSQILPLIKVVSSLITHSVFLVVVLGLILFEGLPVSPYFFQFLYYLFAMSVLGLGLGWAVSALNVFMRDVGPVVALLLQMGFWGTPIFWDIEMMPPSLHAFFQLNPMFYVVQGYRDSFIDFIPFWDRPYLMAYFWAVTLGVFVLGALIFQRLKPQFADVL